VPDAKVLILLEGLAAAPFLRAFWEKTEEGEGIGEGLADVAGLAGA
jgi:hypothetical protein